MIRKSDVQWWVLEAKKHPESAPTIIEELARRLAELDADNERLRDEIIRLERRTPAATDSTQVSALERKVATLQNLLEGETSTEPALVLISDRLQAARMPLPQAQRLAQEGRPVLATRALLGLRSLLLARPHDELLLLTNQGHGFKVQPSDLPVLAEGGDWPSAAGQPPAQALAAEERVTAAVAVAEPPRFWTVVTRRGFVRQFLRIGFDRGIEKGERLVESPIHNDVPVAAVSGDKGDLLLITRWGKGARFPQRAIAGPGSVALELDADDEVVTALSLASDAVVLIVTASGHVGRLDTARFEGRVRPGGTGKPLIQAYDVLGAFPCEPQARLLYLTYSGKLVLVSTDNIPVYERTGKGTLVRDLGRDPAVAVACIPGER